MVLMPNSAADRDSDQATLFILLLSSFDELVLSSASDFYYWQTSVKFNMVFCCFCSAVTRLGFLLPFFSDSSYQPGICVHSTAIHWRVFVIFLIFSANSTGCFDENPGDQHIQTYSGQPICHQQSGLRPFLYISSRCEHSQCCWKLGFPAFCVFHCCHIVADDK